MRKAIAVTLATAAVVTTIAAFLPGNPVLIAPKTKAPIPGIPCPPSCLVNEHKEVRPFCWPFCGQHVHKEVNTAGLPMRLVQVNHKVARAF